MSYPLIANKSNPMGLWLADDTTPLQDYSGYDRPGATAGGTAVKHAALVAGALYSTVVNKTITANFDSPVFVQGKESSPFSLESWLLPISKSTGEVAQTYRENLFINPSGESLTSFSNHTSATPTASSDAITTYNAVNWPTLGGNSIKIVSNGTVLYSARQSYSNRVAASPGDIFSASTRFRNASGITRNCALYIRFYDVLPTDSSAGTNLSSVIVTVSFVNGAIATIKNENAVAPAGTQSVGLIWLFSTPAVLNETMYVDSIMLNRGTTVNNYFDGSMPGYEWAGTANASISRTMTGVSKISYALNPSFETNMSYFGNIGAGGATYTRVTDGTAAVGGSYHRATGNIGQGMGGGVNTGPLKIGTYFISFWVRSSVGIGASKYYLEGSAMVGITTVSRNDNVSVPANTWFNYKVVVTTTLPGSIKPGVNYGAATTNGETVDYDGFLVTDGSAEVPYFDGSSPGGEWSGTANNSASYMLASNSEQQALSHSAKYDGLVVDGNTVYFRTQYLTAGLAECKYVVPTRKSIYVVGVHSEDKNELFVNGELVDSIDITDAQKADQYVATDGKLYSGTTTSSQALAINGVGVYAKALDAATIASRFAAGRNVILADSVSTSYGGVEVPLSSDSVPLFVDRTWDSTEDFNDATITDVSVVDNMLLPSTDAIGTSLAGTWEATVPLDETPATSVYGVALEWVGQGVIVETSPDATTWTPILRGQKVASIAPGYNPVDKDLSIRVSFAGGTIDDPAYLDSLRIVGFTTGVMENEGLRTITLTTGPVPRQNAEPIEYREDAGLTLNGGNIAIDPSTDTDPDHPSTLELWIKLPVDNTVSTSFPGSAFYVNGAAGTNIPAGQWTLFHIVAAAPVSSTINISGDYQLGRVTLYEDALTAAQVADIYKSYTGIPTYRVVDASPIALTEAATPVNIYAHDWSITSSGE